MISNSSHRDPGHREQRFPSAMDAIELLMLRRRLGRSLGARDAAGLANLLAEQACVELDGRRWRGREEVIGALLLGPVPAYVPDARAPLKVSSGVLTFSESWWRRDRVVNCEIAFASSRGPWLLIGIVEGIPESRSAAGRGPCCGEPEA